MKIRLHSVLVNNQESALEFYTEKLGFVKKTDIPAGEHRWLTVVSPDEPEGAELLLEPNAFPAAKTYQKALYEAGIPQASFSVDDIDREYQRLAGLGVTFKSEPVDTGGAKVAVFDDSCGNMIQIYQV